MTEVKVQGIVVSEAVMGDKDKRLILLTRELGKLTVLAKGALSPKSPWRSAAQLFCCGSYLLTKGRTFYYIKEVELKESFYELRRDLDCLSWAGLMAEAAAKISLDGEENRQLLNLLLRGLMLLRRPENDPAFIASVFIWRLLSDSGYRPELGRCRRCGRPDDGREDWGFLRAEGGLVCPECRKQLIPDRLMDSRVRYTLDYIVSAPEESVYSFRVTPEIRDILKEEGCRYLEYQTGERYKSLDFIRKTEEERAIFSPAESPRNKAESPRNKAYS